MVATTHMSESHTYETCHTYEWESHVWDMSHIWVRGYNSSWRFHAALCAATGSFMLYGLFTHFYRPFAKVTLHVWRPVKDCKAAFGDFALSSVQTQGFSFCMVLIHGHRSLNKTLLQVSFHFERPVKGFSFVPGDFALSSVQTQVVSCFMVSFPCSYVSFVRHMSWLKVRERFFISLWWFHAELCAEDIGLFSCFVVFFQVIGLFYGSHFTKWGPQKRPISMEKDLQTWKETCVNTELSVKSPYSHARPSLSCTYAHSLKNIRITTFHRRTQNRMHEYHCHTQAHVLTFSYTYTNIIIVHIFTFS